MTEQEFQQELETRIEQVEAGVPEVVQMKKCDYIEAAVIACICLVGIVAGAFLK